MERRLRHLEVVYRRRERPEPREEPIDYHAVPETLPACFAALTAAEKAEWSRLMVEFHAPGAYHRLTGDRGFFRRLAELDNKVDWHAPEAPGRVS